MSAQRTPGSKLPTVDGLELLDRPLRAHDVRKLRVCAACDGIGFGPFMLNLATGPTHGACVVATLTEQEILALPDTERSKLRLNETGPVLMGKLIDAIANATGSAA